METEGLSLFKANEENNAEDDEVLIISNEKDGSEADFNGTKARTNEAGSEGEKAHQQSVKHFNNNSLHCDVPPSNPPFGHDRFNSEEAASMNVSVKSEMKSLKANLLFLNHQVFFF